jgi:hypothetical protein
MIINIILFKNEIYILFLAYGLGNHFGAELIFL